MSFFFRFNKSINISLFYSHEDENMRTILNKHLFRYQGNNRFDIKWCESALIAHRNSKQEHYKRLNTSDVIVVLVSPSFMDSIEGRNIAKRAMKLSDAEKARLVPVKLSWIPWEDTPFRELKCSPKYGNGQPVDNGKFWGNRKTALGYVAQDIKEAVEDVEQKLGERRFTVAEQLAEILTSVNSFISNEIFAIITQYPNISTRSFTIIATFLIVAALLGFYNLYPKNNTVSFHNEGKEKSDAQKNQAQSLYNQAEQKREKGDYLGAVKDYNEAIQINPNDTDAYLGRAYSHVYQKNYKAAIKDYTQVIGIAPQSADAYISRAVIRCQLKDKQGAIKDDQVAVNLYAKQQKKAEYKEAVKRLQLHQNSQSCSSTS